jgi:hypothetical protein
MNNNTVMSNFLTKQNIELLWDVLLDELRIDINNKQIYTNIRSVFESNINPFTKNTNVNVNVNGLNVNTQLVNLNKQFLSQVVMAVNRLFPNLKQKQEFKRIQISSEDAFEPYKVEDIREERRDHFEKQVNQKRIEFENSINQNKPAELDFSEKIDDGKIKEMDVLIAETVARRKFDIEQIQHTPVIEDRVKQTQNVEIKAKDHSENDLGIYRKLKLKPIDTNTNTNTNKKNVTWTDQTLTNINNINNINNDHISLLIEELHPKKDKIDILTDKVDILIDLLTKLTRDPLAKQI